MLRETLKEAREKQAEAQASAATNLDESKATMAKLQEEKREAESTEEKAKAVVEEKA